MARVYVRRIEQERSTEQTEKPKNEKRSQYLAYESTHTRVFGQGILTARLGTCLEAVSPHIVLKRRLCNMKLLSTHQTHENRSIWPIMCTVTCKDVGKQHYSKVVGYRRISYRTFCKRYGPTQIFTTRTAYTKHIVRPNDRDLS